jgi:hypothetical protein
MSVTDSIQAIRDTASGTPEPLKVFAGTIGALTFSYAGVMDFLRFILLVVTIAYTAVKLRNALRRDRDNRD